MATFNLVITYPDGEQTRILSALKTHWTEMDEQGNPVVPTNAQVVEKLRQSVVRSIRDIVLRVEREAATKAAAEAVTEVNAT